MRLECKIVIIENSIVFFFFIFRTSSSNDIASLHPLQFLLLLVLNWFFLRSRVQLNLFCSLFHSVQCSRAFDFNGLTFVLFFVFLCSCLQSDLSVNTFSNHCQKFLLEFKSSMRMPG